MVVQASTASTAELVGVLPEALPAVLPAVPTVPLPSGWTEHIDPVSQKRYYAGLNGKTQWDRPTKPSILAPAVAGPATAATPASPVTAEGDYQKEYDEVKKEFMEMGIREASKLSIPGSVIILKGACVKWMKLEDFKGQGPKFECFLFAITATQEVMSAPVSSITTKFKVSFYYENGKPYIPNPLGLKDNKLIFDVNSLKALFRPQGDIKINYEMWCLEKEGQKYKKDHLWVVAPIEEPAVIDVLKRLGVNAPLLGNVTPPPGAGASASGASAYKPSRALDPDMAVIPSDLSQRELLMLHETPALLYTHLIRKMVYNKLKTRTYTVKLEDVRQSILDIIKGTGGQLMVLGFVAFTPEEYTLPKVWNYNKETNSFTYTGTGELTGSSVLFADSLTSPLSGSGIDIDDIANKALMFGMYTKNNWETSLGVTVSTKCLQQTTTKPSLCDGTFESITPGIKSHVGYSGYAVISPEITAIVKASSDIEQYTRGVGILSKVQGNLDSRATVLANKKFPLWVVVENKLPPIKPKSSGGQAAEGGGRYTRKVHRPSITKNIVPKKEKRILNTHINKYTNNSTRSGVNHSKIIDKSKRKASRRKASKKSLQSIKPKSRKNNTIKKYKKRYTRISSKTRRNMKR